MALLQPHINLAAWFIPTTITGFCIGTFAVLNPVIATICTPNGLVATSVTIGTSVRGLGGAIGIVMISSVFQSKITILLPKELGEALGHASVSISLLPQVLGLLTTGDTAALAAIPGMSTETITNLGKAMRQAYADSYRYMWYSLLPFCVLTLVAACFLTSTKHQLTEEVTTSVKRRHRNGDNRKASRSKLKGNDAAL
jgi:hypothetical protein